MTRRTAPGRPRMRAVMGEAIAKQESTWQWEKQGQLLVLIEHEPDSGQRTERIRLSPARDEGGWWIWQADPSVPPPGRRWRYLGTQSDLEKAKQAATVSLYEKSGILGLPVG